MGNERWITLSRIKNGIVRGFTAIKRFFRRVLAFLKLCVEKLTEIVKGIILGVSHLIRKTRGKIIEVATVFTKNEKTKEWEEIEITKSLKENEVPKEYRRMDDEFEIDDTRDLDDTLELERAV